MAPNTRSTIRETTPDNQIKRSEHNTVKKARFFNVFDSRDTNESVASISRDCGIPRSTARDWLADRASHGALANRRKRKRSIKVGRPFKISKEQCTTLLDPKSNPVRDQPLEVQIEHHQLEVHPDTLNRALQRETNNAKLYKQAYLQKKISQKNRRERVQYGQEHQLKTIDTWWQWIVFTDEFHIDMGSRPQGRILRERGTRYHPNNIQERGSKTGNVIHCFAWVSYWDKAPKIYFYHDQEERIQRPPRPRKPRHTKYQSDQEYAIELKKWEALLPKPEEVVPKGNAMTEKYYCDEVLPIYIAAIHKQRL
jgi:CENP-B N-terminal DNA-binding domain